MEDILQNRWVVIPLIIITGIIIGALIVRPILGKFEKIAQNRKMFYFAKLLNIIKKTSLVIGVVILLNIAPHFFLDIDDESKFNTWIRALDTVILTFIIAEVLVFVYDKYSDTHDENKVSSLFHIVIRILTYIAGIFFISNIFDYDIKALLTAMGVGGLAIALALQDTLSNLFAGMHILASKQLKPGDYIKIEDNVNGYVLDINWRNTIIKTLLENVIIVPNSKISSSITTNYFSLQKNLYFQMTIGVHYDSDLELVERVTLEVAEQVLSQFPDVPKGFQPKVRFFEFADSSINFKVWLATDMYENQFTIRHHFVKALSKRYNEEGIIIPFPIRTLHIEKGG